jgi:hypothetical protein
MADDAGSWPVKRLLCSVVLPAIVGGCAVRATPPTTAEVVASPPPKDDGSASDLRAGGPAHSAALEELTVAPLLGVVDRQRSIRLPVPDARHWTRVRFLGVPSLLGLRYGKDHHAVIGATVQRVDPDAPLEACSLAFEAWGAPLLDAFDVDVDREPVDTFSWRHEHGELHRSYAKTASLMVRDGYAVAYATYPAWKGACLVVGIAVPARDDEPRARAVRDRFAKEVLPHVLVLARIEPKGRE